METLRGGAAAVLIGLATGLSIVALVLPLFLNPIWVSFEQGRAQATAWTGFTEPELRAATDSILADLVFGPPEFGVAVGGEPVLNDRERGHMRDVRGVFIGFFALAVLTAAAGLAIAARRRGADRARTWDAIRGGAVALVAVLLVGGVISIVAFDALFETFHAVFFQGGSYTFDPATERLVQLFPFQFWQETAIVVGVVCIVVAAIVAVVANELASIGRETVSTAAPTDASATAPATGPTR